MSADKIYESFPRVWLREFVLISCGDFLRAFRIVFFFDTESLPEPFLEKKVFLSNMTVGEGT
jgi:hypothetical protein